MQGYLKIILRWSLLFSVMSGLIGFFYFHGYDYFSLSMLQRYHQELQYAVDQHYLMAVAVYMLVYVVLIVSSIPAAAFITLVGGFLFGPVALFYAVINATVGAAILFMIVRSTLGGWFTKKVSGTFVKIEKEFRENAFNYVLFLRFLPILPFSFVNIVTAMLAIEFRTFLLATFIGIIPAKLVYVMVGNGLNTLLKNNVSLNAVNIFTPSIVLPLFGMAALALFPVCYKVWKRKWVEV